RRHLVDARHELLGGGRDALHLRRGLAERDGHRFDAGERGVERLHLLGGAVCPRTSLGSKLAVACPLPFALRRRTAMALLRAAVQAASIGSFDASSWSRSRITIIRPPMVAMPAT